MTESPRSLSSPSGCVLEREEESTGTGQWGSGLESLVLAPESLSVVASLPEEEGEASLVPFQLNSVPARGIY